MEKVEQEQQLVVPEFIITAMGKQAIQIEMLQSRVNELLKQIKSLQCKDKVK